MEVQIADCLAVSNPDPHQMKFSTWAARRRKVPTRATVTQMVPPDESDSSSSLSGSCSTDDEDEGVPISRDSAPPGKVSLEDSPTDSTGSGIDTVPPAQQPCTPLVGEFNRAPLDAVKLTKEERRKLSVEEQQAKEEAATILRCATVLSNSMDLTPFSAAQGDSGALSEPTLFYTHASVRTEESVVVNENRAAGELLDVGRFSDGVPTEVREGCLDALRAILSAYSSTST